MLYPTIIATMFATLTVIALAAANWYVWGMAKGAHFHRLRLVQPLTGRELADKFLAAIAAANAEVLMVPHSVMANANAKAIIARIENSHGFKRVA